MIKQPAQVRYLTASNAGNTMRKLSSSAALDFDQNLFWSSLEAAVTVRSIATFAQLTVCYCDEQLGMVAERARAGDFDHLPVCRRKDDAIIALLNVREIPDEAHGKLVSTVMQSVGPENLINADAALVHFVETVDSQRCRLVLGATTVIGLVTASDLQKLPVRSFLFSLITHLELVLTSLLRKNAPNDDGLFDRIESPNHRDAAKRSWRKMQEGNTSIERFYALTLRDKMNIVSRASLAGREGFDGGWIEEVYSLRNSVAHASEYAATEEDVAALARIVRELRRTISRIQLLDK